MIKTKGFKLTIIILLSILTISCFLTLVISIVNKNKTNKNHETMAYTFSSSEITQSEYDSNTIFEIKSAAGFKSFAASTKQVNSNSTSPSTVFYSKFTYSGKKIYLNTNIDVTVDMSLAKSFLYIFSGTFDGKGNTISYSGTVTHASGYEAVFADSITGTVKNLCIKDGIVSVSKSGDNYLGIFANSNSGTIENCIVKNCKFSSGINKEKCHVAPFAGKNSGTVKNCMVLGNYEVRAASEGKGSMSYFFTASGNNAENSVWMANWYEVGTVDWWGNLWSPWNGNTDNGTVDARGACNYTGCDSMFDHQLIDSTPYRDQCSTSGGSNVSAAWFRYSSKSQGFGKKTHDYSHKYDLMQSNYYCVYLRVFIKDWTTYWFGVNPSGGGSVSLSSKTVPEEYEGASYSGSTVTISYDNSKCVATANSSYIFTGWTQSGNSFTANFRKYYKLSFVEVSHTSINGSSTAKTNTEYKLWENETISFSQTSYNKGYKTYKISFKDVNENSYYIQYEIKDNAYYITGNTISTSNSSYSISSDKTGQYVNVSQKTYNITFG